MYIQFFFLRDAGTDVRLTKIPAHPPSLRIIYPISIFDMPEDSPFPIPLRLRGVQGKEAWLAAKAEIAAKAESAAEAAQAMDQRQ